MEFDPRVTAALMEVTSRPPLVMARGAGSWIEDEAGKRYLDFVQGWAVNTLGHAPPQIQQVLATQGAALLNPSPAFFNRPALELAQRLTQASGLDRAYFANSGAEANEGAIKLARKWGRLYKEGAYKVITFEGGFHGRTLAMMSASGKPGWDTMFAPQVPGFPKARFNDLASVRALIDRETVAIMLEPVQGESGVVPATRAFLQGLRDLASEHCLLLIFDEVQTGIGRLGELFGFQHFGVRPDILTLAKGIGGGLPLSALLANEGASVFAHGEQGGTFGGNALCTAVGVAMVDAVSAPGFLETVRERGDQLRAGLEALSRKHGLRGERGIGLLRALVLDREVAPRLVEAARDLAPEGLLLNAPRADVLRFMPALNVSAAEVDRMLALLDALLAAR